MILIVLSLNRLKPNIFIKKKMPQSSFERMNMDEPTFGNGHYNRSSCFDFIGAFVASILEILNRFKPAETVVINQRRFTVVKRLGEGGFSFVHLVKEQRAPFNQYALKRIRIQLAEQEDRLRQEIAAHQAVKSPYVLPLVDSQIVTKGPNRKIVEGRLLLPFYANGTVQDLVDKTRDDCIPLHRIISIALDVCKGLKAFHSHNPPLAFRDLKPANILLDDSLQAVLMDLGSVTLSTVSIKSRREAMALQELCAETVTAPFRAPELFDPPSNITITEATDVWAFGCTLYAIAYGESPCNADTILTRYSHHHSHY